VHFEQIFWPCPLLRVAICDRRGELGICKTDLIKALPSQGKGKQVVLQVIDHSIALAGDNYMENGQ
jgi:hypothetical protein